MTYKTFFERGEVVSPRKARKCLRTILTQTLPRPSSVVTSTPDDNVPLIYSCMRMYEEYMRMCAKIHKAQAKHV